MEEKPPIIEDQTRLSFRTMAALNGSHSENFACSLLNIQKVNEVIDGVLAGCNIEIKSCQRVITDNSHSNNQRTGRFLLTEAQHNLLVKSDGFYLFLVVEARQPQNPLEPIKLYKGFLLPARQLVIKINGVKGIPWTRILDLSKV
jgi:hypothetical protein